VRDRSPSTRHRAKLYSPFLFFGNGEEMVGRVCSEGPVVEREWENIPLPDRLVTCEGWDAKEVETLMFGAMESDEAPAESRGEVLFKG